MKPHSALHLITLLPALLLGEPLLAAGEISQEPILRIETGRHLAPITRISSDADGRWAVTASEDKTARLWDLRNGKEIAVLRPPIGNESIGALYAAAMSPDGKHVALGGNSAFDDKTNALYLFDRGTGSLPAKRTLSGIEAPITQLAWTADSQMLALGLRQEGLRVFRRDLGFVGGDPEYNDAIYGAAFSRDGRLAVVSLDGYLRLYAFDKKGMARLARLQIPGKPYAVAWSPDGSRLAIGLHDAPSALILSASSLEIQHRAEAGGAGNLGRVAWSPDGQVLYAAGSIVRDGRFAIFAFAGGGKDAPRQIGGFANTVTALSGNNGGLLASSAEPGWAFFDWSGNPRHAAGAANADYRDAAGSFRISRNAAKVAFPMRQGGSDGQIFDLLRGEVRSAQAPSDTAEALVPRSLRDWQNATRPSWDGKPLALRPGETSRSAALAPDGKRLVLGTDWYLRAYSENGTQVWEKRIAGAAWAVNVSGDGRWVVAALGDGSIRWHRLGDGAEQLALFPHGDRERWIVWTPSGYYDASMGGEGLVGWHVNRSANQAADFFSAGRFRERFNLPGVIQKILDSGDEQEAVRAYRREQAVLESASAPPPAVFATRPTPPAPPPEAPAPIAQALPPVIELQTERGIETGESLVPVRYVVRTPPDAPVKEV
jgi:WD40 repeat protein